MGQELHIGHPEVQDAKQAQRLPLRPAAEGTQPEYRHPARSVFTLAFSHLTQHQRENFVHRRTANGCVTTKIPRKWHPFDTFLYRELFPPTPHTPPKLCYLPTDQLVPNLYHRYSQRFSPHEDSSFKAALVKRHSFERSSCAHLVALAAVVVKQSACLFLSTPWLESSRRCFP